MRLFIAKLFVFVLLISFFCFPSTPPATTHITDGQIVLASSVTTVEQLPVNPQRKDSRDLPRSDLLEFLFGFDRLKDFIASHTQLPAGQFADALIRQLFNWSGQPSAEALDDDLTLIVADYKHGS
jgi:hypothetical protein